MDKLEKLIGVSAVIASLAASFGIAQYQIAELRAGQAKLEAKIDARDEKFEAIQKQLGGIETALARLSVQVDDLRAGRSPGR